MNNKSLIASALAAVGLVTHASAVTTNVVYVTGSTAFRGNVFNVLSVAGNGVFDASPAVTIQPSGAGSGSGTIVYQGNIGGQPYSIDCSWTGSEAGIAATDGLSSLANADTGFNLPGVPTVFPDPNTGAAGTSSTVPDLTFADTSQAVSLTKPPTYTALKDYGTVGIVTFTWLKGNCSPGNRDSSWNDITNISQPQILYQLPGPQAASFFTGNSNDTDTVITIGRNVGSGTHVNMMADAEYIGTGTLIDQWAWNSFYSSANVLTYTTNAPFFPVINLGNTGDHGLVDVGHDGYDSGAFVSDVLSCDSSSASTAVVTLGYTGISDAKHARDGQNTKDGSALTNQPPGAVFLTLDGVSFSDGAVIEGAYSFWGHEHLYGKPGQSGTSAAGIVAGLLAGTTGANGAINVHGGLGDGTAPSAQDTGIKVGAMKADKPSHGDLGYPSQN